MLGALSDFVIALLDLLEAEAKSARKGVFKLAVSLTLLSLAGLLALGALGLFVAALYLYLITIVSAALSAFLCGLLVIVIAGVFVWNARRMVS